MDATVGRGRVGLGSAASSSARQHQRRALTGRGEAVPLGGDRGVVGVVVVRVVVVGERRDRLGIGGWPGQQRGKEHRDDKNGYHQR